MKENLKSIQQNERSPEERCTEAVVPQRFLGILEGFSLRLSGNQILVEQCHHHVRCLVADTP